MEKAQKWLIRNPRKLVLFDCFGALVSGFLLAIVLPKMEELTLIPSKTLYLLAFFPLLFSGLDFGCYFIQLESYKIYLFGIAALNLAYCCLSASFLFANRLDYSVWGIAYLSVEIVIVFALALVEIMVAKSTA